MNMKTNKQINKIGKKKVHGKRKLYRSFGGFAAIDALTFHRCNSEDTYYFIDFYTYYCRTIIYAQIETKLNRKI